MAYEKIYEEVGWADKPNTKTPLSSDNLNKMDVAINELDNRIVSIDAHKLNADTAAGFVKNITYNSKTGEFVIFKQDGTSFSIDTLLEKIVVNFSFDEATQKLTITLEDGTIQYIDLSAFIKSQEFMNSETIIFESAYEAKESIGADFQETVFGSGSGTADETSITIIDENALWIKLLKRLDPSESKVRVKFYVTDWVPDVGNVQVFPVQTSGSTSTMYISENPPILYLHSNSSGDGEGYVEFNVQTDYCGWICLKTIEDTPNISIGRITNIVAEQLNPIDGTIIAKVKDKSIQKEHLAPGFALPNPLRFTGAVNVSYDGSRAVDVSVGESSIDFEAGTWTPVNGVQSTALTDYFDINNASFTKIGNIIMASFTMSLKLAYDAAPSATIYLGAHSGLPYPIKGFITGYCNNSYIMTSEPAHVLYEASPPSFVLKPDVVGNDQGSGADPNRNNRVYLVYEIKS